MHWTWCWFCATLAFGAKKKIPSGSKIFIAPMEGGLDGFIAAEITQRNIPLAVVTKGCGIRPLGRVAQGG